MDRNVKLRRNRYKKTIRLVTLFNFCHDYHSGQWSRLYRLLCRTDRALERHLKAMYQGYYWSAANKGLTLVRYNDDRLYQDLVEKYGDE